MCFLWVPPVPALLFFSLCSLSCPIFPTAQRVPSASGGAAKRNGADRRGDGPGARRHTTLISLPLPPRNNSECLRAEEVDRSAAEESAATAVRAARYTTPLFSQSGGEGGEIHCPSPPSKRRRGRRGSDGKIHSPPLLLPRSGGEGSKVATAVAGRRPRQRRRAGLHAGAAGERRERWRRRAEQQTMAPPSIPFLSSLPSLTARSESVVPQATRNP